MSVTPYRSRLREGSCGFADLLHAEWTKFRTVRGWIIAVIVGALVIVAFALAPGQQGSCSGASCAAPVGPGGEQVSDGFYFVHQPLAGNGSITARVTSLTGRIPALTQGAAMRAGLVPWAKAGIIIKASTSPGSAYAAMMVTGSHGVRMQYDFTQDLPGLAWRRLRGLPALAAADAFRRHDHWLRLGRRHALGRGRHRHPGRAAAGRPGRLVHRLAAVPADLARRRRASAAAPAWPPGSSTTSA